MYHVAIHPDGALRINGSFGDETVSYRVRELLYPGDEFGGFPYEVWRRVAGGDVTPEPPRSSPSHPRPPAQTAPDCCQAPFGM
jgi:hypothetical protein